MMPLKVENQVLPEMLEVRSHLGYTVKFRTDKIRKILLSQPDGWPKEAFSLKVISWDSRGKLQNYPLTLRASQLDNVISYLKLLAKQPKDSDIPWN